MTSTIRIHGIVNGLILIVLLALLGSTPGYAQNEGCTLNGDDADCTDVPVDGIVFVTIEPGAGATEINVSDGVAGTTTVSPTRPGISLFVYGSDGSDAGADVEFQTMAYDHDNDTDTANISVVTKDGTSPYLVNGQYIRNLGGNPPTFSLGGTSYSAVGLAQYLTAVSSDGGGTVSGALTINNPPGLDTPASGTGASFTTTNAPGIVALSSYTAGVMTAITAVMPVQSSSITMARSMHRVAASIITESAPEARVVQVAMVVAGLGCSHRMPVLEAMAVMAILSGYRSGRTQTLQRAVSGATESTRAAPAVMVVQEETRARSSHWVIRVVMAETPVNLSSWITMVRYSRPAKSRMAYTD